MDGVGQHSPDYDVAIVGGSLAGCTAATLYGRAGLRVALLEKRTDPSAYKVACSHFIQGSAVPALERLGLAERIVAAGGVPNHIDLWSRYGWIRFDRAGPAGFNVTRAKLDPMVRELAAGTEGVTFLPGHTARAVEWTRGRVSGVRVRDRAGAERSIRARLVVAADGRGSRVARMAGVRTRIRPHERIYYFAYYRHVELDTDASSQMWFLEPDVALALTNEDGLTVLVYLTAKDRLPDWKADPAGRLRAAFDGLPNGPRLQYAQRVSNVIGKVDMTNERRPAATKGMAFIGDAARASDPLWGIGCGWAFQSAEWLVADTAEALRAGADPAPALRRYRRTHRRRLAGHDFLICDHSRVRGLNAIERLMFGASVHDRRTAEHFGGFGSRSIGVSRFLAPAPVGRAAWVLATRRRAATTRRAGPPGAAPAPRRPAAGAAARRG